jgi:hypothetical protein
MDQVFFQRLQDAGMDYLKLVVLRDEIDSEKRSVTSYIEDVYCQLSEKSKLIVGVERQSLIRRLKDKKQFLNDQRVVVQNRIRTINTYRKTFNRVSNSSKLGFARAFVAAAELTLTEEQFNELEIKAGEILILAVGRKDLPTWRCFTVNVPVGHEDCSRHLVSIIK